MLYLAGIQHVENLKGGQYIGPKERKEAKGLNWLIKKLISLPPEDLIILEITLFVNIVMIVKVHQCNYLFTFINLIDQYIRTPMRTLVRLMAYRRH
ncbi:MAG: hypothetical protein ACE5GV_01850 [Candidatus Scalindua sp.]